MHGDVRLGGALWVVASVLIVITILLALFVVIDSFRRMNQPADGRIYKGLWIYAAAQALYLFVLLLVQVLPTTTAFSASVVALTPLSLVLGIAYLLRVVYPKSSQS